MTLNLDDLEALYLNDKMRPTGTIGRDHVLALIARLREAEAVIEAARESEARTKFITWGRKPTHEDSSHTWRILSAYKPTNHGGKA